MTQIKKQRQLRLVNEKRARIPFIDAMKLIICIMHRILWRSRPRCLSHDAVKSRDPKSHWHSHLRFFFCRNLRTPYLGTSSFASLRFFFSLASARGRSTCETANSRWHTCKNARVDTYTSTRTGRDDRVYKACSTRNGISPRYVATYAFRKWSCMILSYLWRR